MEIVSGLQNASVHRLKQTWAILPPKSREIFTRLVADLDAESNFSKYRDLLHKSKPPIVPYLGMFLTDLVFIYDGNPNYIPDTNLVNVAKLDMLASTIKELQRYQDTPYRFSTVESIREYLVSKPIITDPEELYNLSMKRETRALRKTQH